MLTQRQVVFGGTAIIAIAFNLYLPALLLDDLRCLGQCLLSVGTQISLVIVEVNVFHHLGEKLIVGHGWCRNWSRRGCSFRRYRNLRRGFLRSRSALGGQMIGGGLRR